MTYDNKERRLDALKNKHKDEDCFVLGNGPSLNKVDLTKLQGHPIIACNEIWQYYHEGKLPVLPTYYCTSCNKAYVGRPPNCNGVELVKKMGSIKVFAIPRGYPQLAEQADYYTFLAKNPPLFNSKDDWDPEMRRWPATTTVITDICLPLAYYMGCNRIFLMGVDLDSSKGHCYDLEEHPLGTDEFNVEYHIGDTERDATAFKIFQLYKEIFEEAGVTIYNASPGGKLDIFPRVTNFYKGD